MINDGKKRCVLYSDRYVYSGLLLPVGVVHLDDVK